jgi:predicted anti-sigma-YlaC factor YlaD
MYWTAVSWGAAISLGKDRPDLLADLGVVVALLERGLALAPDWGGGLLHEAMISVEARSAMLGGDLESAREHYRQAVELSAGRRAGPHVAYAENIAVQTQDRAAYVDMLGRALAIDPDAYPPQRLTNVLLQEKARWLLERTDDYFFADDGDVPGEPGDGDSNHEGPR